jgi:hypothetical protein
MLSICQVILAIATFASIVLAAPQHISNHVTYHCNSRTRCGRQVDPMAARTAMVILAPTPVAVRPIPRTRPATARIAQPTVVPAIPVRIRLG